MKSGGVVRGVALALLVALVVSENAFNFNFKGLISTKKEETEAPEVEEECEECVECEECGSEPVAEVIQIKIASTLPFGESNPLAITIEKFVEVMRDVSEGGVEVEVETMSVEECWDGAVSGNYQAAYGLTGSFDSGFNKHFWSSIPFGMNQEEFGTWMMGEAGDLRREDYQEHGLYPMTLGDTGPQAGGFYSSPLTHISGYDALKLRMGGLGGEILAEKAGADIQCLNLDQVAGAFESGELEAGEAVSPYVDQTLGLFESALQSSLIYYGNGWHEPHYALSALFNLEFWESLEAHTQALIQAAAGQAHQWTAHYVQQKNAEALAEAMEMGVTISHFPNPLLVNLAKVTYEYIEEQVSPTCENEWSLTCAIWQCHKDQLAIYQNSREFTYPRRVSLATVHAPDIYVSK